MAITSDSAIDAAPAVSAPKTEAATAPDDASELPEEVLKLPVINSLLNGAPPAVYAASDAKIPEAKIIDKYSKELVNAGFAAYRTTDGINTVFFNQLYVTPDEIKSADASGTLIGQLAVPYEELAAGYEGAKLKKGEEPSGATSAPSQMPAPQSSAADKKMATARLANVAVGSPTSGPAPGQGRILNSALKPVV